MRVNIYIYIYICICMYLSIYLSLYIYVYIHIYTSTHIHIYDTPISMQHVMNIDIKITCASTYNNDAIYLSTTQQRCQTNH